MIFMLCSVRPTRGRKDEDRKTNVRHCDAVMFVNVDLIILCSTLRFLPFVRRINKLHIKITPNKVTQRGRRSCSCQKLRCAKKKKFIILREQHVDANEID